MVDVLPGLGYFAGLLLRLPPVIFYALFACSILLFGPFLLGLHAVVGAIITSRHVWASEFFSAARQNAKQGVVLGALYVLLVHLLLFNMFGGLSSEIAWVSVGLLIARGVSVVFLLLLLVTLPFVCQIIVTIEQPLRVVVKNALILARVYLGKGLLVLFGITVYWWVSTITLPAFSLISLPFFSIALTTLAQASVSRSVVEQRLLAPLRRTQENNSG
ncbi:MAG: hypothetical protein FWD84_00720 [Oscillospiraceae bacterium]|nr:hypothetical protein [Oscillospiraceae bacterium]